MILDVGELAFESSHLVPDTAYPLFEDIFALEIYELDPLPEFTPEIGDGTLIFEATGGGYTQLSDPLPEPDPPDSNLGTVLLIIMGCTLVGGVIYVVLSNDDLPPPWNYDV